jgi:hypothetical protein
MSCVEKLRAALAAVPVGEPCTAAAVGALYEAGYEASQQLSPNNRRQVPVEDVRETCSQQAVPGACMPVLAWLAAGLRSDLPSSATQQAHGMACALLGVVSRVLSDTALRELGKPGGPDPQVMHTAKGALEQLGPFGRPLQHGWELCVAVTLSILHERYMTVHKTPTSHKSKGLCTCCSAAANGCPCCCVVHAQLNTPRLHLVFGLVRRGPVPAAGRGGSSPAGRHLPYRYC